MLIATLILIGVIDLVTIGAVLFSLHGVMRKLLWILAILFLPIVGPVFYFLFGDPPRS